MHILNQFFDKIYCINLLDRPDRRNIMEKRFNLMGLEVEFYNAVKFGWGPKLVTYLNQDNLSNFDNGGEFGCSLSHYACIWMAKVKNYKSILILEDDCVFLKNFNSIINRYLDSMPMDWDMFYLGSNIWSWEKYHIDIIPNLIKRAYKANGAWAYGIHSKFYNKILSGMDKNLGIIDNFYMKLQQDNNNKIYCCIPNLCAQEYSYSDLIKKETNYFHKGIVSYMGKKPEDYE